MTAKLQQLDDELLYIRIIAYVLGIYLIRQNIWDAVPGSGAASLGNSETLAH